MEAGPGVRHVKPGDYQNLFRANRIKLRELLTEHVSLHDINIAMKNMPSGKTSGRCVIKM